MARRADEKVPQGGIHTQAGEGRHCWHPALGSFGGPWPEGTPSGRFLRSPHNLKSEPEILRFALGLFSALAFLEAEDWPIRPGAEDWSLGVSRLPVYRPGAGRRPVHSQPVRHAALIYRMLCGKGPPQGGRWPGVPRRHAHSASWNRWFAEVSGDTAGSVPGCQDLLLKLWEFASELDASDLPPSSWGVGLVWAPAGPWGHGVQRMGARTASSRQAILDWAGRQGVRTVFLGDPPPYPFASLEPIVADALGDDKEARDWMGRHLGGGAPSLAAALASLLGESGGGRLVWPASSLDPASLEVLDEAGSGLGAPTVLLDTDPGESTWSLDRMRLIWLTPSAESWYLEHGKALLGEDLEGLLAQVEALPPGEPRCGSPLLPPTPPGLLTPARDYLGAPSVERLDRKTKSGTSDGAMESLLSQGRLATLLLRARALKAAGDPSGRGRYWEGAAFLFVGQPAQALALWDGLEAVAELRGRLALNRARAHERLQDLGGMQDYLKAAQNEQMGPEDAAYALLMQGQLHWLNGDSAEADRCYDRVLRADRVPDAVALAHCNRAFVELQADRVEAALRCLSFARKALPEHPQPLTRFLLAHREALVHHRRGRYDEALAAFLRCRALASSLGMRSYELWADLECGRVLDGLHRLSEAADHYRRAEEGAAGLGLDSLRETARFNRAICLTLFGGLNTARRIFEAAIVRSAHSKNPIYRATDCYWLAYVLFQLGDFPAVLEWCETGLKAIKRVSAAEVKMALLNLRGEVLLATGQSRKLSGVLAELAELVRIGHDPGDGLVALGLRCAAAGKRVGAFGSEERRAAESLLARATPSYRSQWYLLAAFGPGGSGVEDLVKSWEAAREARTPHLASRALWALAEAGALPIVAPADREWISHFLTANNVRSRERGLVRLLATETSRPSRTAQDAGDDLALLEAAREGSEEAFEGLASRLEAAGGCRVEPGRPIRWWGGLQKEQRKALIAASGSEGQQPRCGGVVLGCKGENGSWCGIFRPSPAAFSSQEVRLAQLWTLLNRPSAQAPSPEAAPVVPPAISRHLLTRSPAMRPVLESLTRAAAYDYPVLLTGEPGVGKEACALAIHAASRRASKRWVPANCANLTPTLAASLLFGHRRGAFTGADRDHEGLAESARGGTLFLDEVGDLPVEVQPQVLRFLQDGTYLPLGETRTRESDARVVCATNRDLPAEVAQGRFREDLFHRLNVIWIVVPPLRRRPEDIPMLFDHFLAQAVERDGIRPLAVESEVLARLASYPWPGNVRELQNLVKALIVAAHGTDSIREEHLPARLLQGCAEGGPRTSLAAQMEDAERAIIGAAVAESGRNLSSAARRLSISRQSLFNKMRRLGIRKPE